MIALRILPSVSLVHLHFVDEQKLPRKDASFDLDILEMRVVPQEGVFALGKLQVVVGLAVVGFEVVQMAEGAAVRQVGYIQTALALIGPVERDGLSWGVADAGQVQIERDLAGFFEHVDMQQCAFFQ